MDIVDQARAEVAALEARTEMRFPRLTKILAALQKVVASDKALAIAVLTQAAVALVSALKFHMSASGVATVSTIVAASVSYFLHMHFKTKLAAAKK